MNYKTLKKYLLLNLSLIFKLNLYLNFILKLNIKLTEYEYN